MIRKMSRDGEAAAPDGAALAGGRIAAAVAGCAVPAAASAWFLPGLVGAAWLPTKFALVAAGNFAVAAAAGILAPLLRRAPQRRPARALAFWLGFLLGSGALAGAWIGWLLGFGSQPGLAGLAGRCAVPGASILLLLAAPFLARWRAPGPAACKTAARAALAALAAAVLIPGLAGTAAADPAGRLDRRQPLPLPAAPTNGGPGPDVVLVSVDTLRADAVLDARVPTPALDALRQRGLWSDYACAPYPGTLPSHISLLTGVGILRHGARANDQRLPAEIPTLAETLRSAGWRTVAVVSNFVLRAESGVHRGFEVYENLALADGPGQALKRLRRAAPRGTWLGWLLPRRVSGRDVEPALLGALLRWHGLLGADLGEAPGWLARDMALAYLDELAAGPDPYFLFLHFMDPHQPYDPDPAVAGRLRSGGPMPERYRGFPPGGLELARAVKEDLAAGVPEARDAVRALHEAYLEEVMFVDECIGRVLARVDRAGRPAVVIVTADHGEHFGEHGLMLHGVSVYETLLRVPFVLAGPGLAPGKLAVPPRLEDVVPTVLALCEVPVPAGVEGRDLLRGSGQPLRHVAADSHGRLAYRDGEWKLVVKQEGLGTPGVRLEPVALYDVGADPAEERDLLAREPERASAMLAAVRELVRGARPGQEAEATVEDRRLLDELGYAGAGGTAAGG